ncbi:MAG: endolytic transglycosylase MltG [Mogibacterium sp.]|nr:endolytic transglycosylase MltG [Mogibacterium sp.]
MKEDQKSIKRFHRPLRIITVLIILAALILWFVYMMSKPYNRTRTTYADFVVEEGDELSVIAEHLDEQKFIKSSSRFEMLGKITLAKDFKPGTYYLSPSMDSFSILKTLQSGLTTSKGFTIPAGYTIGQLAAALDRDGLADKKKFLEAASSPDLAQLDVLGENPEGLKGADLIEGFLLPGEYTLSTDADETMMIIMMLDAFSNFFDEDCIARTDELGITTRQLLVLASMIEKETSVDKERATVSGVIHNRINMELTSIEELPEKPLCSPSRESIMAALYPEEHEYTYYVLNSTLDGTHKFTADEDEYNTWLEEYENAVKEASEETEEAGGDEDKEEGSESEGEGE